MKEVPIHGTEVVGYVKLQIPAGKATPAPPVGPALGQHGVNIQAFTKGSSTSAPRMTWASSSRGHHRLLRSSFSFITKNASRGCADQEGVQHRVRLRCAQQDQGGHHLQASVQKIAELKMRDLNAASLEAAMSMIAGTARSMGVVVGE